MYAYPRRRVDQQTSTFFRSGVRGRCRACEKSSAPRKSCRSVVRPLPTRENCCYTLSSSRVPSASPPIAHRQTVHRSSPNISRIAAARPGDAAARTSGGRDRDGDVRSARSARSAPSARSAHRTDFPFAFPFAFPFPFERPFRATRSASSASIVASASSTLPGACVGFGGGGGGSRRGDVDASGADFEGEPTTSSATSDDASVSSSSSFISYTLTRRIVGRGSPRGRAIVSGGGLRRSRREALGTPIIGTPIGTPLGTPLGTSRG